MAQAYQDFLDVLICDTRDARAADTLRKNGLRVQCTQTIMRSSDDKAALAREALACVAALPATGTEAQPQSAGFRRLGEP